ncbi:universal stress protein [uncultured Polaribacter sp.]|uniref:universal stress protein n=1 Tax=uncultured Polaribacter sp. TaxID=174711 RepID=UPI00260AF2DF|nr:universal stress protein [uncultured Polaribacter sp.]
MNRNKYKVLVLSNLEGRNAKETLKYGIDVCKEIDGALELFCVKKPREVVTTDNPLSAMRRVNKSYIETSEKAKSLIREITKDEFFAVKTTIEFGNVKNEIEHYIASLNPDVIILGERQKRFFRLNTDSLTNFITKKYTNKVFITNKNNVVDVAISLNQIKTKGQSA